MGYEDILAQFEDQDLLDSIYGFAYRRCSDSYMAEDLCSEILLAAIKSARKNPDIEHFHAFIWAVAKRVYADFCERRKRETKNLVMQTVDESAINIQTNPIDEFIANDEEQRQLNVILRCIAFLSKIYRDVMVMYYIDGCKISHIAATLGISETAVKQRLFSARRQIIKEAEPMQSNITLKPIDIAFIGTGNPLGNDPRGKADRILSKNLVYLCRNQALTTKEIAEKLNIPLLYVEDEIDIQLRGENGSYGLLRRVGKDRFISNVLLLEIPEIKAGMQAYTKHLPAFCEGLKQMIQRSGHKILEFPWLSKQDDVRFVLWTLISKAVWRLDSAVCELLKNQYFSDIELIKRDFSIYGFVIKSGESFDIGFYGCDEFRDVIREYDVYGYTSVFVSNVYGHRLDKHFSCDHHVLTDPLLLITLRAIKGLKVSELTDDEKEVAAKAIECGYLRKDGDILTPKIVVFSEENEKDFFKLLDDLNDTLNDLARPIADELSVLIKRYVPKHLMNEYTLYSMASSIQLLHDTIEACISEDLLTVPQSRLCAEGVMMIVK